MAKNPKSLNTNQMVFAVSTLVAIGLSGAGKSSTLRYLKDLGFFCVDAIPPHLSLSLLTELRKCYPLVALGLECNRREFVDGFPAVAAEFEAMGTPCLFLEADDEVLARRFDTHRRRHPLADVGGLTEAIAAERRLLEPIRQHCHLVLDTSQLSLSQLHRQLDALVRPAADPALAVSLVSFGFKYGVPSDANLLFDIRFLPNPYYVPELRLLTGRDRQIREFLFADAMANETYQQIRQLVGRFLPHYRQERRGHLLVGIGCTGGQHRSVAFVERLARDLREDVHQLHVVHRHLETSRLELQAAAEPTGVGVSERG
jgi:UPF0042 nucleotide-binding protein